MNDATPYKPVSSTALTQTTFDVRTMLQSKLRLHWFGNRIVHTDRFEIDAADDRETRARLHDVGLFVRNALAAHLKCPGDKIQTAVVKGPLDGPGKVTLYFVADLQRPLTEGEALQQLYGRTDAPSRDEVIDI